MMLIHASFSFSICTGHVGDNQMAQTYQYSTNQGDFTPPVFEKIFKNARFAQGGNALFEGKLRGNPKPTVSWSRGGNTFFSYVYTFKSFYVM